MRIITKHDKNRTINILHVLFDNKTDNIGVSLCPRSYKDSHLTCCFDRIVNYNSIQSKPIKQFDIFEYLSSTTMPQCRSINAVERIVENSRMVWVTKEDSKRDTESVYRLLQRSTNKW